MFRRMSVWNLGKMSYGEALKVQNQVASHIKSQSSDGGKPLGTLLLVEHNPVFTVGLRSKEYSVELERTLKGLGAEFYKSDRGGLITFHGPGQLVAYPIVHLKQLGGGIKWYVTSLENVVIDLCRQFGLEACTTVYTGVWVGDCKICAIGIHGSRQVVTHGLALNCCTDLEWFSHIVPCGIEGKGVTSLTRELGTIVTLQDVIPVFLKCFSEQFNCNLDDVRQYSSLDCLLRHA